MKRTGRSISRRTAQVGWVRSVLLGLAWGWVGLACALGSVCAQAQAVQVREPTADEVKAAYVHRFAGFVEWPAASFAAADSPIVVGVAGAPGLQRELAAIVVGRLVQGRPLQVIEVTQPREAASVHMLVIGRAAWKRAGEWMSATKGHPVLTVTDMAQGLERGAALVIVETESRLRFEASVPAAEQAGLRLSSRLLSVAERVVKAGP